MSDNTDLKWLSLTSARSWLREATKLGLKQVTGVLRGFLANGSLAARGICSPDVDFGPIPRIVWRSGQIDWDANQVVFSTDKYENVKVDRPRLESLILQIQEKGRVPGGADAESVKADPHQTGGQGRTTLDGLQKQGVPKPETIAKRKADYDLVKHLMDGGKCGATIAARKARIPGGRSADAIERSYRYYLEYSQRQNGNNSDQ